MSASEKTSPASHDHGDGDCDASLKSKSSHNLDEDEFDYSGSRSKASHPSRSRRKISMPWFRQSSFGMSLARLRLPKQHTIATENLDDEKQKTTVERDADVAAVSL